MKKTLLFLGIISGLSLSAQSLVDTTQSNKNVFLEEYTGRNCGYCPDGHKIANDIKEANPNDIVLMRIHTGGYAPTSYPNFNTSFGPSLADQSGITGYPTGTVNRHVFAGSSSTSMSRSLWSSKSNEVLSELSVVNIGMNAVVDTATNNLFVEVELYYTDTQAVSFNRVNIAILQDNIYGSQGGASAFNPDDGTDESYNHKHILRHMLFGVWGDQIDSISKGTFVRKTASYSLPTNIQGVDIKIKDLDIVAYVIEDKQEMLNVTHMRPMLGSAAGVVEKHSISPLVTYPNPTNDKLNVEFEVRTITNARIELINMLGQTVISHSNTFSAGNRKVQLDVNGLESGFYLLKVSNGKTSSSSKVMIR